MQKRRQLIPNTICLFVSLFGYSDCEDHAGCVLMVMVMTIMNESDGTSPACCEHLDLSENGNGNVHYCVGPVFISLSIFCASWTADAVREDLRTFYPNM